VPEALDLSHGAVRAARGASDGRAKGAGRMRSPTAQPSSFRI
jgi:hypothetical protein